MGIKVLITGATGFLGSRIAERLLDENGKYEVTGTGRDKSKVENLIKAGVNIISGNLEDEKFVSELLKNVDIVVHSAALSSPWGKYEEFYRANILSTRNIISACKKNGVKRLVNISTPSIYFDYTDRFNIKEDFLPSKFVNYYAETKYEAEKLVQKANNEGVETLSLRPRAIIGRGDMTIMPRLLRAQNEGRLKIIGDGKNIVDVSSAYNVAEAVITAIHSGNETLGQNYNITNGSPVVLWEFIEKVFKRLDLKLNKTKIPFFIAFNLAKVLETAAKITPEHKEPVLTCYGVGVLAKSMTLNLDKSKNILGYVPKQTNDEAIDEFVNWWKK